jgi:RNA polymerase sigma-70 factor (ECF subfamily)
MERNVYEEFYPKIYNYVYYRVLNKADAEDITSEVFLKAFINEAVFDPRRAKYSTWLFAIAHNRVANFYRDRKNTLPFDALDETAADSFPGDALMQAEDMKRLRSLLETLPERSRAVLALRFWGGFSHGEIAKQMDLSEKNVSVILSRTIAKLREAYLCEQC